jgi:hypothetical protein
MTWRASLGGATDVVLDSMLLIYFPEDTAPCAALCESLRPETAAARRAG